MNILWILLFSGLLSLSYCADNTTGNNNENGRDPRNDQEFPPHFIRVIKKTSKKECINLIVSGAYKFLNRKFKNNKLYFECNVPQSSAKAHAIVTAKITRILCLLELTQSIKYKMEVAPFICLTKEFDSLNNAVRIFDN